LLGPLPDLKLNGIDWVIVGGESGPAARPMLEDWVIDIRDQCLQTNTPFFFKQWGSHKNSQHWITDKLYTDYLSYKQFPAEIAKLMEGKNSQVNSSRKVQKLPSNLHQD
jgi:protein gp37